MKRYEIDTEIEYGRGMYDGAEYHSIVESECPTGEWVKYEDVKNLQNRINRMQARINRLEGRA